MRESTDFLASPEPASAHDLRGTIHAGCPEAVCCAHAQLQLPFASARVFDCLRNLACLADWWPGATGIAALPPGVYGAGDAALLQLDPDHASVRVIAYKPGRRIVLSVQSPRQRVLVDLRVRGDAVSTQVGLSIESPRASTLLAQTLQGLRLRALCRNAGARLERHLRHSPLVTAMDSVHA
jgi:uncharacterized protein YndB with AHSA1/START domain